MALLQVPVSASRGTYFDYQGTQIRFSSFRENPYAENASWSIDISWNIDGVDRTVGGIVLTSGIDLVQQYDVPIPNLFVLSADNTKKDPISLDDLKLYILEEA